MQELIERLEKLTGPSTGANHAIMTTLYRYEKRHIGAEDEQEDGSWKPAEQWVWVDPYTNKWVSTHPFNFTHSIDRALTLLPAGWDWSISKGDDEPASVAVAPRLSVSNIEVTAATPAVAMCIAAFKARGTLLAKDAT